MGYQNNDFEININNSIFDATKNTYIITIFFNSSEILKEMKKDKDFYFIQFHDNKKETFNFSYSNLDNSKLLFKDKDNKMTITLSGTEVTLEINEEKITSKSHRLEHIEKIKFFNYFYYENITKINMEIKDKKNPNSPSLKVEFKTGEYSDECQMHFDFNIESVDPNMFTAVSTNIKFTQIKFRNNREWVKRVIGLEDIKYYGGIECFIPLFKIIAYILGNLKDNKILSKQEREEYISQSIIWMKDIIKVIVGLISISEENYNNFKKCIVPLIGAIVDISIKLNDLKKEKLLSEESKNSLFFKDEIFYSLYIAIVYARPNINIIDTYKELFNMKTYWKFNEINFKMDYLLYDIKAIKESNLIWYFSVLFSYASFIRIFYNSLINSPVSINKYFENNFSKKSGSRKDFNEKVNSFVLLIQQLYSEKKIEKYELNYDKELDKSNKSFLKLLIVLMKTLLNVEYLSKIAELKYKDGTFNKIFKLLKKNKIKFEENETGYEEIIKSFRNYGKDIKLIPFIELKKDQSYNNIFTNELVDYHGEYHKVMKELFSFNRLWSKEKLFDDAFNKRNKNVKYKVINYYTRNFQRPIVYPVLDYKNNYPKFSRYEVNDTLYRDNENEENKIKDDYNFNFKCTQFDNIVNRYHRKIYKDIKWKEYPHSCSFNICLVKQGYHVKGTLFLIVLGSGLKIVFFSNSYNFKDGTTNKDKCNKYVDEKENKPKSDLKEYINTLCYGQIIKCPEKEYNRKIEIDSNDIRMILQKIYYYRKSAVEIFTETKSYFFNFFSEKDFDTFKEKIENYLIKKKNYFMPIKYKNEEIKKMETIIGYIKINTEFVKNNQDNSFIDFISHNEGINKICHFDLIILLNLIANRSYLDLNQYPVFPVLFFREKENKRNIERKFDTHIGFHEINEESLKRKNLCIESYEGVKNAEYEQDEEEKELFYFNTNYSNPVYAAGYLLRLFPYSFWAIELQGDYFDTAERLFFSLEGALTNISIQKSDLRELIPEFFYLPEMFININNINIGTLKSGQKIDDVVISEEIIKSELDSYKQVLNIKNENENRKNIFKAFLTIIKMKEDLEGLKESDFKDWLDLIFGKKQRYLDYKNKEGQFFRTQCYIDVDKNTSEEYMKKDVIMDEVEFGLIPLKIILDEKESNSDLKNEDKNQNKINIIESKTKSSASDKYYWDNEKNQNYKVINGHGQGKIEIYNKNEILIDEIIDHSDEIIDFSNNSRLNMFLTCSFDGLICIYVSPKKLISIIRHPEKLYFDQACLSANPFPTVVAHDKKNCCLYSYSLNGILINKLKYDENRGNINDAKRDITINYVLDVYGGCLLQKDLVNIIYGSGDKSHKESKWFELPFFNEIEFDNDLIEKSKYLFQK